jgi:hypothetical protein
MHFGDFAQYGRASTERWPSSRKALGRAHCGALSNVDLDAKVAEPEDDKTDYCARAGGEPWSVAVAA